MKRSNRTKQDLASSLKYLMRNANLSDISVQDIVDNSGISRHTFYYHFIDKQDLVQWVFRSEVLEQLEAEEISYLDRITAIMALMQREQTFYIRALDAAGQNSFGEFFFETINQMTLQALTDEAQSAGVTLEEEEAAWVARYATFSINGIVRDWVKGSLKEDPVEVLTPLRIIGSGIVQSVLSCLDRSQ